MVNDVSAPLWQCWYSIYSEEICHPSTDLPFILDFIDPPSTSGVNEITFRQTIIQVNKLINHKLGERDDIPFALLGDLPSPQAVLPQLLKSIGAAIDLARRNGRDPIDKILAILEEALILRSAMGRSLP